jgi:simple sugar transport system substrate-binding protein
LVAKVNGIPWFNRMGVGVKEAADKLNVNAYQTGPATPDPLNKLKSLRTLLLKMLMQLSLYQMMQRFWSLY